MKTQSDYYSKILGMSLTQNPTAVELSASLHIPSVPVQKTKQVSQESGYAFLLLAHDSDVSSEKEMVSKILKALGVDFGSIITSPGLKSSENIYTFGDVDSGSLQVSQEFPSLSDIAKDQTLKKELWDVLKVFKK